MNQLKNVLLIRSLISDEINNVDLIDCSEEINEDYISKLLALLKNISPNLSTKLSPQEKSDIVLLLANRISLIDDEFKNCNNQSDLTDEELFFLKIMRDDCSALLNKFTS